MRLDEHIKQVEAGIDLTRESMSQAMDLMMRGAADEDAMARLLKGLHEKGETVEEIVGAAQSLRRHMRQVVVDCEGVVDTCGTGGDRSGTFNISTAAAIVAAAAGVPIAKHGNRSVTSRSGSADVLVALGVSIDLEPEAVARCIEEVGIGFCLAPRFHPSMKHVAAVRRSLGIPTIFNLLGPLCNPANAPFQLIGVGIPALHVRLAEALQKLGTRRSYLVHGADGLDEVTSAGETAVWRVDATGLDSTTWTPRQFGVPCRPWAEAVVESAEESADQIRRVLTGESGVARDLVVLNAAVAIALHRSSEDWSSLREEAAAAIDTGRAAWLLEKWIEVSRS